MPLKSRVKTISLSLRMESQMWSVADMKRSLLDPRAFVREYAADYLADCWATDADVLPTILQAIETFGTEDAYGMLKQADRFQVATEMVEPLVGVLSQTSNPSARQAINRVLDHMSPAAFAQHHDMLRCDTKVEVAVLQRLRRHREMIELNLTPEELWGEMQDLAGLCDQSESWPKEIELGFHETLIREMAPHAVPSEEEVVRLLSEYPDDRGDWQELFLINLAGARGLKAAVPELIRRLPTGSEILLDESLKALARIADASTIETLQAQFASGSWSFKNYAIGVLSRIKITESEAALIDLLETETDLSVRSMLCMALCRIGSKRGIELVLAQIEAGYMDTLCQLTDEILPVSCLHNVELPKFDDWLEAREARESFAASMLRIDAGQRRTARPNWSEPALSDRPLRVSTTIRSPMKVSRNEPCPCGSNKKYKKCCGG